MKIAVLGAGAMGTLYGGYLSKENDVTLVDRSQESVSEIEKNGVRIKEKDGSIKNYRLHAAVDFSSLGVMDLVIVFVKSMYTESVLEKNKSLIGKNTYLMTLQNGGGHEKKLLKYSDEKHVIIGTTQHNSSRLSPGFVSHAGCGITTISLLSGDNKDLENIKRTFSSCSLECVISNDVKRQIWKKLFTNTAASSLTALLQVPLGFIHTDKYANELMRELAKEAVMTASCLSLDFDLDEVVDDIEKILVSSAGGYTSIYCDIKEGRKTEVDSITGYVVETAHERGLSVPYHEMVLRLIHALEDKGNG